MQNPDSYLLQSLQGRATVTDRRPGEEAHFSLQYLNSYICSLVQNASPSSGKLTMTTFYLGTGGTSESVVTNYLLLLGSRIDSPTSTDCMPEETHWAGYCVLANSRALFIVLRTTSTTPLHFFTSIS